MNLLNIVKEALDFEDKKVVITLFNLLRREGVRNIRVTKLPKFTDDVHLAISTNYTPTDYEIVDTGIEIPIDNNQSLILVLERHLNSRKERVYSIYIFLYDRKKKRYRPIPSWLPEDNPYYNHFYELHRVSQGNVTISANEKENKKDVKLGLFLRLMKIFFGNQGRVLPNKLIKFSQKITQVTDGVLEARYDWFSTPTLNPDEVVEVRAERYTRHPLNSGVLTFLYFTLQGKNKLKLSSIAIKVNNSVSYRADPHQSFVIDLDGNLDEQVKRVVQLFECMNDRFNDHKVKHIKNFINTYSLGKVILKETGKIGRLVRRKILWSATLEEKGSKISVAELTSSRFALNDGFLKVRDKSVEKKLESAIKRHSYFGDILDFNSLYMYVNDDLTFKIVLETNIKNGALTIRPNECNDKKTSLYMTKYFLLPTKVAMDVLNKFYEDGLILRTTDT